MKARDHPLHSVWRSMWRRCTKPADPAWRNYGGRGISVCERWKDFWAFASDMGARPDGHTLDRVDNDLGYSPGNCRWATRAQQLRNRRNNVVVTIEGREYRAIDLADKYGVRAKTIAERAKRGLSFRDCVFKGRHRASDVSAAIQARIKAQRTRTHCKRGHELTPENISWTRTGARSCRLCRNITTKNYRARLRAARGSG